MTPARHDGHPGQPTDEADGHSRIPDDLYEAAVAAARVRRDSLSEIVRQALEQYIRDTSIG